MVVVKCKRCGYEWEYTGKSDWYISCSRCKTTINIRKIREENRKKEKRKDVLKSEKGRLGKFSTSKRKSKTTQPILLMRMG